MLDSAFSLLTFDALQWPAMVVTLISAWLVACKAKPKRNLGFYFFVVSNILWMIWGWFDGAYALIVMQTGLLILNVLGVLNNETN